MRISATLLAVIALCSPAAAQAPAGAPNAQTRQVSGYHAIAVSTGIDLYLHQGAEAVAVSAAAVEDRDRIRTTVEKGVLKIWYEPKATGLLFTGRARQLRAYVSAPTMDGLSASGGSEVRVEGPLSAGTLNVQLSGGSSFTGQLTADSLNLSASGGSDTAITGRVARLTVQASGASDFGGYGLAVDSCTVAASGDSDVTVTVNRELTVQASGGSDVLYAGNGHVRAVSTSGGSSVKRVNR